MKPMRYSGMCKLILAAVFMLVFALNANAKIFQVQNESVDMFVVNGSSGNIILNPNSGFGNVGIGTTSPKENLHVGAGTDASDQPSTMIFAVQDANAGISVRDNDDNVEGSMFATGGSTDDVKVGASTNHPLSLITNNAARLTIDTSGNVGIGTVSPQSELTVKASASSSGGIILERTGTTTALVNISSASDDGIIKVNTGGGVTVSQISGYSSTPTYFTSNVGIGTTSPNAKLDVAGTVNATRINASGYYTQSLLLKEDDVNTFAIRNARDTVYLSLRAASLLYDGSLTPTSSSTSIITQNADNAVVTFKARDNGVGLVEIGRMQGGGEPFFQITRLNVTANASFAQDTLFVDNTSSRVGIGTTSPGNRQLEVYTAASNTEIGIVADNVANSPMLRLQNPDRQWTIQLHGGDNDKLKVVDEIAGLTRLTIDTSGNVGIGTTSPGAKLEVVGNLSVNGSIDIIDTNGSLYQPVYGTDDDLVLYLPFNAPNGTTQYDRSPYGNDGTLQGGVNCNASLGKYGAGCLFNNETHDFVNVSKNNNMFNMDYATAEAWVKTTQLGTRAGIVESGEVYLRLASDGSGKAEYVTYIAGGTRTGVSTTVVTDGNWHYLAYTFDGNVIKLYVDGKVENTQAISGTLFKYSKPLHIGQENNFYFNGSIDEVRIYKRALTAEEIRTHYLRGKGFGASGAITADKFRVVNTSGSKTLELNTTGFDVKGNDGDSALYVDKVNSRVGIGTASPGNFLHLYSSGNPQAQIETAGTGNNFAGLKFTSPEGS
jgi:hypothetical protein